MFIANGLQRKVEKLRRVLIINNHFWSYPLGSETKSIAETNALIAITFLDFYQKTKKEKLSYCSKENFKDIRKETFSKKAISI